MGRRKKVRVGTRVTIEASVVTEPATERRGKHLEPLGGKPTVLEFGRTTTVADVNAVAAAREALAERVRIDPRRFTAPGGERAR